MLRKLFTSVAEFGQNHPNAPFSIHYILEQIVIICGAIEGKSVYNCPLCGTKIDQSVEDQRKLSHEEISEPKISEASLTLKSWKDTGYQETLKGLTIRIENGPYEGKDALFLSWSGTVAKVRLIDDSKIIRLNTKLTEVKVYELV